MQEFIDAVKKYQNIKNYSNDHLVKKPSNKNKAKIVH